jgi:hypothetical protein
MPVMVREFENSFEWLGSDGETSAKRTVETVESSCLQIL